jgi:hypothetical protein
MRSSRTLLASLLVAVVCGCLSSCGSNPPATSSTTTTTATPTTTSTPTTAGSTTSTSAALPALVGAWERHGKQDGRPYSEHFAIQPDGTYSIKAVFDDTAGTLTETYGTYVATQTTLTLTDKDGETTSSPYSLDATGDVLTIDNKPQAAWTRAQ